MAAWKSPRAREERRGSPSDGGAHARPSGRRTARWRAAWCASRPTRRAPHRAALRAPARPRPGRGGDPRAPPGLGGRLVAGAAADRTARGADRGRPRHRARASWSGAWVPWGAERSARWDAPSTP
jgi:hypothetical protein